MEKPNNKVQKEEIDDFAKALHRHDVGTGRGDRQSIRYDR